MFAISPVSLLFFFLMIRRPPRSTLDRSSAASDVYKRQTFIPHIIYFIKYLFSTTTKNLRSKTLSRSIIISPVSYTHLRAHETVLDIVCRLLLEKKIIKTFNNSILKSIILHTLKSKSIYIKQHYIPS